MMAFSPGANTNQVVFAKKYPFPAEPQRRLEGDSGVVVNSDVRWC